MDFATWSKIALICALGAMSPGPSLAIIVRNTISGGRLQGVMAATGHGLGVFLYALAAVTSLALLLKAEPALFEIAGWAGAGVLAWIGFQLWRTSFQPRRAQVDTPQAQSARGFMEGFGIALINPKIAVFFVALFSQFIRPEYPWLEKGIMVLTAGIIDTGWYLLVALFLTGSGLVNLLRRREIFMNRVMGTVLLMIAVWLAVRNLYMPGFDLT